MAHVEKLEDKIAQVVDLVANLRRENAQLKVECESLKAHIGMLTGENGKAQKVLAHYEQLSRRQAQATHRVERALNTLNALRSV